MTQPDPRKIVAEEIQNAATACYSGGGFDEWKDSDEYFATVCSESADAVLAALRDAGWEDREQVALRKHDRDLLLAELGRRPAPDEIETLFRQRDEAIEELDRLRRQLAETRFIISRTLPVVDLGDAPATEGES